MPEAAGRDYLTCRINSERIGIAVSQVQEVTETQSVTPVPNCPAFLLGMMNLRGAIIPVMDLWQLAEPGLSIKTVVLLNTAQGQVGLLITELLDILPMTDISASNEPPEALGNWGRHFTQTGSLEENYFLLDTEALIQQIITSHLKQESRHV